MSNTQVPAPTESRAPIEVGGRGLILRTLEDMYRFAKYVAASGLAPRGLEKPEAIVVALEFGLELGLSPAQSLQNVAVINGRACVWGDTMLALCMSAPAFDHERFHEWFDGEPGTDQFRAVCRVGRKGRAEPIERSFSVRQAKLAKLWGRPGPWTEFPERMLQMRARSWALRDAFPDVLRGFIAAEEMIGIEPVTDRVSPSASVAVSKPPARCVSDGPRDVLEDVDELLRPKRVTSSTKQAATTAESPDIVDALTEAEELLK